MKNARIESREQLDNALRTFGYEIGFDLAPKPDLETMTIDELVDTAAAVIKESARRVLAPAVEEEPKLGGELADLVTPHEAAKRLGVKVGTVYRLRKEGALKAVHVGRWVRFDPEDLIEYRRQHKRRNPIDDDTNGTAAE